MRERERQNRVICQRENQSSGTFAKNREEGSEHSHSYPEKYMSSGIECMYVFRSLKYELL